MSRWWEAARGSGSSRLCQRLVVAVVAAAAAGVGAVAAILRCLGPRWKKHRGYVRDRVVGQAHQVRIRELVASVHHSAAACRA